MAAPAITRAYVVIPAPDATSVKKELLRVAARGNIIVSLVARKLYPSRRTRLVMHSALELTLDQYVTALSTAHPSWAVERVDLEPADDAAFTEERIWRKPDPRFVYSHSTDYCSSGSDDASYYSVSIRSGVTASAGPFAQALAALELERAEHLAAGEAAMQQAQAAMQQSEAMLERAVAALRRMGLSREKALEILGGETVE